MDKIAFGARFIIFDKKCAKKEQHSIYVTARMLHQHSIYVTAK